MASAEPSLEHDLPPELEGLATFLELEETPVVIFRVDEEIPHIAWTNESFKAARIFHDEISRALVARKDPAAGKTSLKNTIEDGAGRIWDIRQVPNGWRVAVSVESELSQRATDGPAKVGGSSIAQDDATGSAEIRDDLSLDWLISPTPDLDPWTRSFLEHDWAATPLGPSSTWSATLRTYVLTIMINPDPRIIVWDPQLKILLYNEAAAQVFGDNHPRILGRSVQESMPDVWADAAQIVGESFAGNLTMVKNFPITINRSGDEQEDCFFDATLTPIVGPNGTAVGVLDALTETTKMTLGERRRQVVSNLGQRVTAAVTLKDLWMTFLEVLQSATSDAGFAVLYTVEDGMVDTVPNASQPVDIHSSATRYVFEGSVGILDTGVLPQSFPLPDDQTEHEWLRSPIVQAWKTDKVRLLETQDGSLPQELRLSNPQRVSGGTVNRAVVIPIIELTGKGLLGTVIIGLSPRCVYDFEYGLFMNIFREVLGRAAAMISLPIEQRRVQRMAEEMNESLAQQLRLTTLQVEQNEAKFLRLAKYSPTGMFAIDRHGKTVYANDAYARLVVDADGKPLGPFDSFEDFTQAIHPDDADAWRQHWDKLVKQKSPAFVEFRLRKPWKSSDTRDGNPLTGETWLLATAFPEVETSGEVSMVMGWVTDISHQKFSESILSQRLEDALENKRQTENFIDMTSHEMRNPLSAILQSADSIVTSLQTCGMSSNGASTNLPVDLAEEVIDSAQTIILCAQHQKRIVDDILTLSKLDASLLLISPDECEPPSLVDKAFKMYADEIERSNIKAKVVIEPTYTELNVSRVMMDSSRFLQVVINLLTNALKFLQKAEVRELTIHLGASYNRPSGKHHGVNFVPTRKQKSAQTPGLEWGSGEPLYLQVAVVDTGSGISAEEMKLLFQRFAQASPKTYKQYGGSGLGLFISRELAELQGGQIGCCSANGRTAFTFYVVVKRCVTDEAAGMPCLTRFVSASSSPVAFSRRGSSVMVLAQEPVVHQLNAGAEVLLNGNSNKEAYPYGTPSPPVANATTAQPQAKPGHMHVLLVEDNFINQKVMSQQLRKAGLTVHVANHGLECLDFVSRSSFSSPPTTPNGDVPPLTEDLMPLSIILLDLEMPTMDGLTCIRHIRERQLNGQIAGHIPVIAVTANARSEQIAHAIEAGMDQVVTKPFRIPELVPQMHKLIAEVVLKAGG